MPFTLEELLPRGQQLRSVQLHEPVTAALNLMMEHGFDQLPIVDKDGKRSLKMVVTFDSVLQALLSLKTGIEKLQVNDVAKRVATHANDSDLLGTLDDIQRENFALIVDEEEHLTGIVTTSDTTEFFREYAEDLMLIEGIETQIKETIQALYADESGKLETAIAIVSDHWSGTRKRLPNAIKGYCEKAAMAVPAGDQSEALAEAEKRLQLPKAGKAFDRLTFDEYIEVLARHPKTPTLTHTQDVSQIKGLLQGVRDSRNKLAHFRGELSREERNNIRFTADWLERNLPIPVSVPPESAPPPETQPPQESVAEVASPEDTTEPHGSYAKLAMALRKLAPSIPAIYVSFQDIENILGKELPRSAGEYRAWWTNDPTKPQSIAWLGEGWRATAVNMTERKLSFVRTDDRKNAYITFFAKLNARLKQDAKFPLRDASPQGVSWHTVATLPWFTVDTAAINATFTKSKELRIELYLDCGNKELNKARFDELFARRDIIESNVGEPLSWERMDDRKSCRIAVYTKGQILTDSENDTLVDWAAGRAIDFYRAFSAEFAQPDRATINVKDKSKVQLWAQEFRITEEALRAFVKTHGNSVEKIRAVLKT